MLPWMQTANRRSCNLSAFVSVPIYLIMSFAINIQLFNSAPCISLRIHSPFSTFSHYYNAEYEVLTRLYTTSNVFSCQHFLFCIFFIAEEGVYPFSLNNFDCSELSSGHFLKYHIYLSVRHLFLPLDCPKHLCKSLQCRYKIAIGNSFQNNPKSLAPLYKMNPDFRIALIGKPTVL